MILHELEQTSIMNQLNLNKPTTNQKQTSQCYLVLFSLYKCEHEIEILDRKIMSNKYYLSFRVFK